MVLPIRKFVHCVLAAGGIIILIYKEDSGSNITGILTKSLPPDRRVYSGQVGITIYIYTWICSPHAKEGVVIIICNVIKCSCEIEASRTYVNSYGDRRVNERSETCIHSFNSLQDFWRILIFLDGECHFVRYYSSPPYVSSLPLKGIQLLVSLVSLYLLKYHGDL
jgi:hypothetical protein